MKISKNTSFANSRSESKVTPKTLCLTFKYVNVNVECNPEAYDDMEFKQIQTIVNQLSKEILIDYSYVQHSNTKYEKTFIAEKGWKTLCSALNKTNFGKLCSKEDNDILSAAYSMLIIQYLYQTLNDLGYDVANIYLEILENSKYMAEIQINTAVDNYPGKWQAW